jgi:hypothetical protein
MIQLGVLHYVYIVMVLVVIVIMALKKDVVLPCIAGLFIMGLVSSGSVLKAFKLFTIP